VDFFLNTTLGCSHKRNIETEETCKPGGATQAATLLPRVGATWAAALLPKGRQLTCTPCRESPAAATSVPSCPAVVSVVIVVVVVVVVVVVIYCCQRNIEGLCSHILY
jgi:hypothetical protein